MFLVDLVQGRIVNDEEIKGALSARKPYGKWLKDNKISLSELDEVDDAPPSVEKLPLVTRQKMFGYTLEDLRIIMSPMAGTGVEAVGSMGTDTPLAVLSDEPQLLYNYFKQHFAQITNPAIDSIREELVMSLKTYIGAEGNVLFELPDQAQMLELPHPILTNDELSKLRHANVMHQRKPPTLPMLFRAAQGGPGLKAALDELCRLASVAVKNEHGFIILSDRGSNADLAPVPALLAVAAVHHHLVRNGTRTKLGIIVETGEAREVHHFCLLTGFGAGAINPYVALETLDDMVRDGTYPGLSDTKYAQQKYIKAINKGILKVMAKMGISTLQSYRGAQIFEAIGLSEELIDRYFTGTASRPGRASPVESAHHRGAPARRPHGRRQELRGVLDAHQRAVARPPHATRHVGFRPRREAGPHRRGGGGHANREALRHRRDELWLHQLGGTREPRQGDEPHRRP
jgi:glutamate synthase (NADPH/NADH) large chain